MFCFKDPYRYSYKTHHKSIISILSIGPNTEDINKKDIIKEVVKRGGLKRKK